MNAPADDAPFDEFIAEGVTATLYDNDAQSHPQTVHVLYSNARYILMIGSVRGNMSVAVVPSTTTVTPGQVLSIGGSRVGWYIVAKILDNSVPMLFAPGVGLALLPIPYQLTRTRYSTGQAPTALNWNEEPYLDAQGTPVAPSGSASIRVGSSNDFEPLTMQAEGQEPSGIITYYCPYGADIQKDDRLTLPDGRRVIVQQVNGESADGALYAKTLIFNEEG